jgi:hypothetical protein
MKWKEIQILMTKKLKIILNVDVDAAEEETEEVNFIFKDNPLNPQQQQQDPQLDPQTQQDPQDPQDLLQKMGQDPQQL